MKEIVYQGKWIKTLKRKTETEYWEYVERNNKNAAVVMICITPNNEILLIKQLRHTFNKTVIEFPAGLIDEGETPEKSAIRELKEETGCSGVVLNVSPPVASSSGLSTEILYLVKILITDTNGEQRLEDGEKIDCEFWKLDDTIIDRLKKEAAENNYILSSRLLAYLSGIGDKKFRVGDNKYRVGNQIAISNWQPFIIENVLYSDDGLIYYKIKPKWNDSNIVLEDDIDGMSLTNGCECGSPDDFFTMSR
jgi:8-oxo-dGTP pyrophosphatase MutT (NUDIX family)